MKKTGLNYIFSLLNVVISTVQSLWLLGYVQRIMGVEAFGYIAVVTAVVNTTNVLTLAFSTFTARYVSVAIHQGRDEAANRYFNSSFAGMLLLSGLCLIIFVACCLFIENLLNVQQEYVAQARLLLLLVGGSFIFNSLSTPLKAGVYYSGDVYFVHILQIGSYLSRIIFAVAMYSNFEARIWYAYMGSFVFDVISFFLCLLVYRQFMPTVFLTRKSVSWSAGKEIMMSGTWASINKAGASLLTTVNTYIINMIASAYITGVYSTITQFVSFNGMLTMSLVSCFVPSIYKSYAELEDDNMSRVIELGGKTVAIFMAIFSASFIVYEKYFLNLMISDAYLEYQMMIALTMAFAVFVNPSNIIEQALIAYDKFSIPAISQLIAGVCNVVLIYFIYLLWGADIYTVIVVTMIVSLIRNFLFIPLYFKKISNVYISGYYVQILRAAVMGVLSLVVCKIAETIYTPFSWDLFISETAIVGCILLIMAFLGGYNFSERKMIFSLFCEKQKNR